MRASWWSALWALGGFAAGAMMNRPSEKPAIGADAIRIIDWQPAERFQMHVGEAGDVWRLDKATGTVHFIFGNKSFDIPEYRNDE